MALTRFQAMIALRPDQVVDVETLLTGRARTHKGGWDLLDPVLLGHPTQGPLSLAEAEAHVSPYGLLLVPFSACKSERPHKEIWMLHVG